MWALCLEGRLHTPRLTRQGLISTQSTQAHTSTRTCQLQALCRRARSPAETTVQLGRRRQQRLRQLLHTAHCCSNCLQACAVNSAVKRQSLLLVLLCESCCCASELGELCVKGGGRWQAGGFGAAAVEALQPLLQLHKLVSEVISCCAGGPALHACCVCCHTAGGVGRGCVLLLKRVGGFSTAS